MAEHVTWQNQKWPKWCSKEVTAWNKLAYVASICILLGSKERSRDRIFGFGHTGNETRAKKWKWGEGEGKEKKGNACRQIPRLFASEHRASLARLVEQYWHVLIKVLFHTERSRMVHDTHIKFLWLLSILDTRFAFQCKSIFFDFFWNAKLFLRLNRSFNLFPKVPPGSE